MDEEDSNDELFNKGSRGKGKRPAASLPSDEDHSEDDSEEATDSEDDEDSLDVEDEDGEEEEMEDNYEGDEAKEMEEALENAPADLAGLSSDEDAEKCPICLNPFCDQPVATPENCAHYFCVDCIHEWAKKVNSCPVDRIVFNNILLRKCFGGEVKKTIAIKKPVNLQQEQEVDTFLDDTHCEMCGGSDREDRMLLCDGCDAGYHMECLTPPLDAVPVEEWFCPQCAPNSHTTSGAEQLSEDENSILPTTSRSRPRLSRPGRAIARTQHSERVRANVNRHRIMQARTAAQVTPQNLMQSTWLDETINAVLARLNTGRYQRDFTTRSRPRKGRRPVRRRRKPKKQGKATGCKTSSKKVKMRKRKTRRTKSRRNVVAKKETTSRCRIAQSLGLKKPTRGSSIPSVYRPYEQTLSSMRAEIGAASLSIYGDSAVLSSSEDEKTEQAPGPSSLLEAKYRGLSRSALRSHQPVARPITAGLSRQGHSIPLVEEVAEAAPVPDLLGSILSGQTLLLMDSSNVIINRDGSLKPTKPVCLPSSSSISVGSALKGASSPGTDLVQSSREIEPFFSPLTSSTNSSLLPCPPSAISAPLSPPASQTPPSVNGHLSNRFLERPVPLNSAGNGHGQWDTSGVKSKQPTRATNVTLDTHTNGRGNTRPQNPAKKPPPKPVWVDVSTLPKIPKIKKENTSLGHNSTESNSNNLPDSFMTSLAGDKGRQHSVDHQGTSANQQNRTIDNERQRVDNAGPSSSFSNSFSSCSLFTSEASNQQQSSSSTISFRISSSRNPWHARRLSVPETSPPAKDEKSEKRNKTNRKMLLLSLSQAKKTPVKSEVYDPFEPTGSDSSECEDVEDKYSPEINIQSTQPTIATVGQNEDAEPQLKMELDSPVEEENHGMCVQVKKEPTSSLKDLGSLPSQLTTRHTEIQSEKPASVLSYGVDPETSDGQSCRTHASPFTKTVTHSRSRLSSICQSDKDVKLEIKTEPDLRTSPVKVRSSAKVPKGNGFLSKQSSVAGSFDASDKGKEREIGSPCFHSSSSSQSSPSKALECPHGQRKHSESEESRLSSSRSPVHRPSRSKHNEHKCSQDRKHLLDMEHLGDRELLHEKGCSGDKERSHKKGHSGDREHSQETGCPRDREHLGDREHSQETGCPGDREHSHEKGRSGDREHSHEKGRSGDREHSHEKGRSGDREHSHEKGRSGDREHSHEKGHSGDREHSQETGRSGDREHSQETGCPGDREHSQETGCPGDREHSQETGCPGDREHSQETGCPGDREHSHEKGRSGDREHSHEKGRSGDREHSHEKGRSHKGRSGDREHSHKGRSGDREHSHKGHSGDREHSQETGRSGNRQYSHVKGRSGDREHSHEKGRSGDREYSHEKGRSGDREHSHKKGRLGDREHSQETGCPGDREHSHEKGRSGDREHSQETGCPGDREHSHEKGRSGNREHSQKTARSGHREHLHEKGCSKDSKLTHEKGCSGDSDGSGDWEHSHGKGRSGDREHLHEKGCSGDSDCSGDRQHSHKKRHSGDSDCSEDQEHSHEKGRSKDREHSYESGRSRDKVLSHEKGQSREREHSRTQHRSQDWGHSRNQRCSAQSSSRESSRERKQKSERHEPYISREEEQQKLCTMKNSSSDSRSRSRSKERNKEQLSLHQSFSVSKDEDIQKLKRKRSTSGDQQQSENVQHIKRSPQKTEKSTFVSALVLNLSPVSCAPMDTEQKIDSELTCLPIELKEESMGEEPLQEACTVKQEPEHFSDEDVTVEYLIDNLNFIKKEIESDLNTEQSETVKPKPTDEQPTGAKQDSASAMAGTKATSQGKRVTWNIQEPEVPHAERMSKLALFKMKLKQEGSRKAASKKADPAQDVTASASLKAAELEGGLNLAQGSSQSQKEECSEPQQKGKYLKKLHMQERAIEEVKLAIKPFYQKRDITKEEYKEILRKAVQKVCHSKSGEINPVKVANLVKAYVDKYKYARKHHKEEELGQKESAENTKDP